MISLYFIHIFSTSLHIIWFMTLKEHSFEKHETNFSHFNFHHHRGQHQEKQTRPSWWSKLADVPRGETNDIALHSSSFYVLIIIASPQPIAPMYPAMNSEILYRGKFLKSLNPTSLTTIYKVLTLGSFLGRQLSYFLYQLGGLHPGHRALQISLSTGKAR